MFAASLTGDTVVPMIPLLAAFIYVGGGILGTILIVLLIIFLLRRA